jgi:apolipoprotein N-acyltransferase
MKWLRRLLRPSLTGVLGALAFPFVPPGCNTPPVFEGGPREIAIVGAAFLLYRIACDRRRLRARVGEAFFAGWVHFGLLLYWLDIAMVRFGGMPQWQAVPAIFLLVAYCALYWAALPLFVALATSGRLRLPPPVAFAFAVVALEWLRGVLLTGFPWGLWGYSQARNLALVQLAALAGVYGVSWVVALAGALLSDAVDARRGPHAPKAWTRVVAVVAAAHAAGWVILATRAADRELGTRVAVVQGNIEQKIKNRSAAHRSLILREYLKLTRRAVGEGADVVVWPEAAWPGSVHADARRLPGFAPGRPVLVGAAAYRTAAGERQLFNSVFWVHGDGRVEGRYDKRHLVPFGEYVPLRSILPLEKVTPGMLDYGPGHSADPLGEPPWGILICYDGIFPDLARDNVRAGAAVLANLTNDGWYGVSSAPYQHRDFYVLRAVETDRWMVRAANTGVSFFTGPDGRIHGATELETAGIALVQVWPRVGTTFYVLAGDWLPAVAIGGMLGLAFAAVWDQLRRRRARKVPE